MIEGLSVVIPHLAAAKPDVNVGWTPAATMGAITNLILAAVGGGGLKVLANHFLQLRTIANKRAEQVDARSDGYSTKLAERVDTLERAQAADRLAHLDEMRQLNATHAADMAEEHRACEKRLDDMREQLREMQQRLDGFMRGLVQYQSVEAKRLPLSPHMERAVSKLDEIHGTGETPE